MPDRSVMSYAGSQTQGHLDREMTSGLRLVRAAHGPVLSVPTGAFASFVAGVKTGGFDSF